MQRLVKVSSQLLSQAKPVQSTFSAFTTATKKKYYLLHYNYVDDMMAKRDAFRAGHLKLLEKLKDEGYIIMAGAYPTKPYGAAFVFKSTDTKIVEQFVRDDPYNQNDLVTSYNIREWAVPVKVSGI
eukprot:TRINITY_DN10_c0_g1_i1.p1 TRINITY_DN10_c0_g1~~TRINITY_DN10_c0_g1_i1.p1  ORF type:complete len:126 (-),score=39.19 TRINITY_DN10_c0_g1_i1:206-583(-)